MQAFALKQKYALAVLWILACGRLSPTQANPSPVENQIAGVGALGQIEPRSRVVRVSHNAGAEGVNLQQLFCHEGSLVTKGETLAVLADQPKKQADVAAAKAQIQVLESQWAAEKVTRQFHEKELARYQQLGQKAFVSEAMIDSKILALQQAQAGQKQLQAQIANAKALLQVAEQSLANTRIVAPMAGTILKIYARPGERLGDNGLLEMADLTALDVVAEVNETDLPYVRVGQQAEVRLTGLAKRYHAEVRELGFQVGKNDLNATDPLADKDSRTIDVRLTLEAQAVQDLQHQIYRQVQLRILP